MACRVIMACALADSASASAANSVDSALASRARIVDSTLSRFGLGSAWCRRRRGGAVRGSTWLGAPGGRWRQRPVTSGSRSSSARASRGQGRAGPGRQRRHVRPSRVDRRPASRHAWTRRRCRPSGLDRPRLSSCSRQRLRREVGPRSDRRTCSTATIGGQRGGPLVDPSGDVDQIAGLPTALPQAARTAEQPARWPARPAGRAPPWRGRSARARPAAEKLLGLVLVVAQNDQPVEVQAGLVVEVPCAVAGSGVADAVGGVAVEVTAIDVSRTDAAGGRSAPTPTLGDRGGVGPRRAPVPLLGGSSLAVVASHAGAAMTAATDTRWPRSPARGLGVTRDPRARCSGRSARPAATPAAP